MVQVIDHYITSQSQAAIITGAAIAMHGYSRLFVTTQWTAGDSAAAGTQRVEGSVDGVNWVALVDSAAVALAFSSNPASGGAGASHINVSDVGARFVRVVYPATTPGTGLYSAQVSLK